MSLNDNPLWQLREPGRVPDFDAIRPEHAEPAIRALIEHSRAALDELLAAQPESPDWETLMEPLEAMDDDLARVWSPISHLFGCRNSPAWREAYQACQPLITAWGLETAQNRPLFEAHRRLADTAGDRLSPARRRALDNTLRAFRHGGAELEGEARERFTALSLRLSERQTQFEQQLMDCTEAWSLVLESEQALAGLPASAVARARQRAEEREKDGWLLGLDFPSFDAVISHAEDRGLRETVYRAYVTRAAGVAPHDPAHDNGPLIDEILALRREQAQLLGHGCYAELALEDRMVRSAGEIEDFLLELARRARPRAEQDLQRLGALARERDGLESLEAWDLAFYSERLREQDLRLNAEALRPYLAFDAVLGGMFELATRLYGVDFRPVDDRSTWHPDVRVYRLESGGETIGHVYLDPFARDGKRSGAWMDDGQGRHVTRSRHQLPVAYLVCNFTPPGRGQPALMTHDEMLTLFHEFGHGLHHLLTEVDEASISGISGVAWDAVELPSQFMENWCYEPAVLRRFARHHETGETLPEDLIAQLQASRRFLSGLATLRQIEFALFDLRLHASDEAIDDVHAVLQGVREEVAVFPPPDFNRFECSFSHIFAGGYAAGYYSYKWAEVLSSDAFAAFEEAGLDDMDTARRFRHTILARGGSESPAQLFEAFRGRPPRLDALLRHDGLADTEEAAA